MVAATQTEIILGKGKILVDRKTAAEIEGKTLSLVLESEKGPCDDVSCQLIRRLDVKAGKQQEESWILIEHENLSLAVHPDVYRSIDRGRETVTLKVNRSGKFTVRGFAYVS